MKVRAKIGRNDPCPCGSGLKYKNCHLGKPLPWEEGAEETKESPFKIPPIGIYLGIVGLIVSIGVGFWKGTYPALIVAAAWFLGLVAYLSFREPPPPNENPGDPAALNFGRPND